MENAKKRIEQFFLFIDERADIKFVEKDEQSLLVEVKVGKPQILIGEKGQSLMEIEKLVRIMILKEIEGKMFINLDINDYKKKKAEYLISLAKEAADDVVFSGVDKEFPPMTPFERRVVHTAVKDCEGVMSESIGDKDERRVVIRKDVEEKEN